MKTFTLGRLAACLLTVMAMLPLAAHAQDCQFTPNVFPGQAADRTALEVNATVHVGDFGAPQPGNNHTISNAASSNTNVVYFFRDNIYFIAAGTSDVTYTESIQRTSCTWDHIIHYNVEKGIPMLYFAGLDGSPIDEYNVRLGATGAGAEDGSTTPWTPSLVMQYKVFAGGSMVTTDIPIAELSYQSTNTSIAIVSNTGITLKGGVGEVTLTVSWPGNANWEPATATMHLTVKRQVNISFEQATITDKHIGDQMDAPTPTISEEGLAIHWTHTNPQVATVNETTGHVTVLCNGRDTISAVFDGNSDYYPAKGSYVLLVSAKNADLSFDIDTAFVEVGVPWTPPTVNNPHNLDLTKCKWGVGEWNDPVASIDESTGAITIKGPGTTTISCEYQDFGCVEYGHGAASYVLRVKSSGVKVLGIPVTSVNKNDVLGDGGSVTFEETELYRSVVLHSANIDGNGASAFILDSILALPLRVMIDGNSAVTNVQKGIVSLNGAILMWGNNKKDTLTITATNTAMEASYIKIHDSYIFANGANYGLYCPNELGISAGGYVFARGTGASGVGIYLHPSYGHFVKGEGGIGGIQVLTKGVWYNEESGNPHGFLWEDPYNKTPVTFVEIGKVPLPITAEAVTDIDFDGEGKNPDENLKVVFSESKDDGYNETEKQLEIATTISDDELEASIEANVICSSDFLKDLPGVLVFDVPAGAGSFEIQCHTMPGYMLKAQIEGANGTANIVMNSLGWATVYYNVLVQTHVIIYLQAEVAPSPAPAKAPAQTNDATVGAYIKAIKVIPANFEAPKYYVVGSFTNWLIDDNYRMTLNEGASAEEYMFVTTLTTTNQFKVKKLYNAAETWYPELGTNYGENGEITEDGEYTIYFRPNGNYNQGWFYDVIYVAKNTPSGIDEISQEPKANCQKFIKDGQLFIENNGHIFNALGVEVK